MKWIFLIVVVLILSAGLAKHSENEESVAETVEEMLKAKDCKRVEVIGTKVPLSFTFLNEKVDGEVILLKDGDYTTAAVTVTPLGGLPIVSIAKSEDSLVELNMANPFGFFLLCRE